MSEIRPRDLTCPLCSHAFSGWLVLAQPDRGPQSSDLRRFPEGEDPLQKLINGCPECGWAGEVSAFEEMKPKPDMKVPAAMTGAWFDQTDWDEDHDPMLVDRPKPSASTLSEQVREHLAPRAATSADNAALRYENHANIQRWLGLGPLREGDAWLRAAWMHEDKGQDDDGRRCRVRALHCYRQGITEKRWFARREDLVVIAYLTGELHRRLGEAAPAIQWFEQAVAWSSGMQRLEGLVELAERQASDPRDLV